MRASVPEEVFMPFRILKIFRLYLLTFASCIIVSCIENPSYNSLPLILTADEFNNQTALCVIKVADQNSSLVSDSIWKIYRDNCTEQEIRNDFGLSDKLKNGLTNLTVSISDCTIDGYREIQTVNDISVSENIQAYRLSYSISSPVKIYPIQFDASLIDGLVSFTQILSLYDARLYLGVYAEDDLCRNSIPLTSDEREMIAKIRSGSARIFNTN